MRSQTCATTGVPGSDRRAPQGRLSVQVVTWSSTASRPSGPQPLGTARRVRRTGWTWDTSRSDCRHPTSLTSLSAQLSTTTEKNKNFAFLAQIWSCWTARNGPGGPGSRARGGNSRINLIAQ